MTTASELFKRATSVQPQPVHIVRPKGQTISNLVVIWVVALIDAWLLMLVVPGFTNFRPGYWQAFMVIVAARCLAAPPDFLVWDAPSSSGGER